MAVNTGCEDVDGRIEDLGEAIADMVIDGGSWGAQSAMAKAFADDRNVNASWAAQRQISAMKFKKQLRIASTPTDTIP